MVNQNKKEQLFHQILKENDDRIKRICSYYHRDRDAQKDIYQEILTNIWKSLDHFRGDAAPSTWVYRVAVNTSLTYVRKASKENRIFLTEGDVEKGTFIDEGKEEKEMLEQNLERLEVEINQLSVIDKMLVTLMLEKLTMEEISNIIGISTSNVKVKIHRIKETLRKKILS